jgi:hypothetical protein
MSNDEERCDMTGLAGEENPEDGIEDALWRERQECLEAEEIPRKRAGAHNRKSRKLWR